MGSLLIVRGNGDVGGGVLLDTASCGRPLQYFSELIIELKNDSNNHYKMFWYTKLKIKSN